MHIFEEVLFFKLPTTEKQTISSLRLCLFDAGRLAEGKAFFFFFFFFFFFSSFLCFYVVGSLKKRTSSKCARFVLFCPIKTRSL